MVRKTRIRIKTPSKTKIRNDLRRAVTRKLTCPSCGSNMPTTASSSSRCPRCGFTFKL